jgi:tetratricopeptide (TPR) repeat protein
MSTAEKSDGLRVEDRLSHLVAIGAVLATLLAGLVAYLLVQASNDANDAGLQADKHGIQAMGELSRAMSDAEADYQAFVVAEALRTQQGLSRQEMKLAPTHERHALAENRWRQLADQSMDGLGSNAKDLHFGGLHGPEVDTSFPEHFLAAQTTRAVRYAALQDAYNERASEFGGKVSKYIAIVTMFGVALYLFALLSVSIQYEVRRLFAIVGAVLLLAGSGWAAAVWVEDVRSVSTSAARAFSEGHVRLASAHSQEAYREAIHRFDTAIRRRPTYARAYFERATARLLLAATQRSGASVISPAESLETTARPAVLNKVTKDLEMAHAHGLASAPVLGRLGHYTSLRGLKLGETALIEEGLDYTRQAVETDPAEPTWRYHRALGLLAMNAHQAAMTEYRRALCLTSFAVVANKDEEKEQLTDKPCTQGPMERTPRSSAEVQLLKAEALSNLELVAMSADQETRSYVQRAAGMLVASTAERPMTVARSKPQTLDLDVTVRPTDVTLALGELAGTSGSRLSVVTSYQPAPSSHHPYVVPELSAFNREARETVRLEFMPYSRPFRCLPDGRYRVDVYADGVLVGRGVTNADFDDVHQAAVAPDVDLRACVPDGWKWFEESLPGLMYGKQTQDGTHGAYLFRFEEHPIHGRHSLRMLAKFAVRLVAEGSFRILEAEQLHRGYFGEEIRNALLLTYRIDDAVGVVRVGFDGDGSVAVALVKGPPGYVETEQARAIAESVGSYYDTVDDQ